MNAERMTSCNAWSIQNHELNLCIRRDHYSNAVVCEGSKVWRPSTNMYSILSILWRTNVFYISTWSSDFWPDIEFDQEAPQSQNFRPNLTQIRHKQAKTSKLCENNVCHGGNLGKIWQFQNPWILASFCWLCVSCLGARVSKYIFEIIEMEICKAQARLTHAR